MCTIMKRQNQSLQYLEQGMKLFMDLYVFYKVTLVYSENKILSCWTKSIITHSK